MAGRFSRRPGEGMSIGNECVCLLRPFFLDSDRVILRCHHRMQTCYYKHYTVFFITSNTHMVPPEYGAYQIEKCHLKLRRWRNVTSVNILQSTRRHIPEYLNFHPECYWNLNAKFCSYCHVRNLKCVVLKIYFIYKWNSKLNYHCIYIYILQHLA